MARYFGVATTVGATTLILLGACSSDDSGATGNTGGTGGIGGVYATGSVPGTGGLPGGCPVGTLACNGACVPNDASNCGTCGNICGAFQMCNAGVCACQAPYVDCGAGCIDVTSDPNNCNGCGVACTVPTPYCSMGACAATCGVGETDCSGFCVNTSTSLGNCGTCGNICGAGQTCNAGVCTCTPPAINCGGVCVDPSINPSHCGACNVVCSSGSCSGGVCLGGGSGGTGGTGGTGGSGGTTGGTGGGDPGEDVTCTDSVYGSVTISADAMIDDFSNGTLYQLERAGRGAGADEWHAYAKGDTNDQYNEMETPGEANPKHSSNHFEVDAATSGPCNSGGSLHVSSPGGTGSDFWGVGFGIDFMARTADRKKQTYDASAYTGVGFWARCTADAQFAYFKAVDQAEDADVVNATCSYDGSTICNQYGIKNAVMTNQWTYYKLYFDELLQDPDGSRFTSGVDPSKLTAFQIHVNSVSNRNGDLSANNFECWIDDVHFLTEAAPQTPTSVTWTTSGKSISRDNAPHTIRGLVRPSMEWDVSGFGVTREDIQRMKAWGPNAIRLAVNDEYWDQQIYRDNVKRVVSWILQEEMDAILDLHHIAGMPTSQHASFWSTISSDSFYQNGRIIYELYNEPTGDASQIASWMQSTVNTIRQNGANNLILVGGTDYTYDISYYGSHPIQNGGAIAYVTHPYAFKTMDEGTAFLNVAANLPVIATEFGDAKIDGHDVAPNQCEASIYSNYISKFENAGMSWTAWAWIVDEWGCGFPQILQDYSGTPNAIGTPIRNALQSH